METTSHTCGKAVAAFWLGVLAVDLGVASLAADLPPLLLGALAVWVPALFLAAAARLEVNRAPQHLRGKGLAGWAIALPPAGLVAALVLLPWMRDLREAGARRETAQRLRQIVLAMRAYAADHGGRLPPAALRDSGGLPLLSWRVLLLPYLGQAGLYNQFKLDEPWDSPANLPLLAQMPAVYAPPEAADAGAEPFATFWQVPLGDETAFAGQHGLRVPEDFPKGIERTVLLVEAPGAVWWTRPVDEACRPSGPGAAPAPARNHFPFGPRPGQGFHVALGDGTVCFLPAHRQADLQEMICRFETEVLSPDW
jgi:hypothetical protein